MRRKAAISSSAVGLVMGFVAITQTLSRPRMADVHTVDILSLIAGGACIGVGIVAVIAVFVRGRITDSPNP